MKHEVLKFEGVQIEDYLYGGLRDATFSLYRSEAVVIAGLLDSGLVTLTRILGGEMGAFQKGRVFVNGRSFSQLTSEDLNKAGIAVIGRRARLSGNITFLDNIRMLNRHGGLWGIIQNTSYNEDAAVLINLMQLKFDEGEQRPYEQVKREILAAFSTGIRIMVFTNMADYCSNEDFMELNEILKFLKEHGVTLVMTVFNEDLWYYTEVADRCLVVRKGIVTMTIRKGENSLFCEEDVRHVVMGRRFPARTLKSGSADSQTGERCKAALAFGKSGEVISFQKGQIAGIYDENLEIPFTLEPFIQMINRELKLLIDGSPVAVKSPKELAGKGIAVIPNVSADQMIFRNLSPVENVAFFAQHRLGNRFLYRGRVSRYLFRQIVERYSILKHCAMLENRRDCFGLSEEEVFELMVAKWLAANPFFVILFPSPGNEDIKRTERFRDLQRELAEQGKTVLLISNDYDRLEQDCNEIYTF